MSLRLVIVDARSEGTLRLERALAETGFTVLDVIPESADMHQRVADLAPDAVIIDSESPSRDTLEGLASIGSHFPRPIVMLSGGGGAELVRDAAQLGISAYVIDGVSPALVRSLIEVAMVHFRCQRLLAAELEQTRTAFDERRRIDSAKCALMEREGLSERNAYQRLRRMAMDRGQRMVDIARMVLAEA